MADLRAVIETLGFSNVRTLLNSGNAVFTASRPPQRDIALVLQKALAQKTGVSSRVTLRSASEWAATVGANPLVDIATDPTRLFAAFVTDAADMPRLAPVVKQQWKPERVALGPGVAYIWCPKGLIESKAIEAVGKALGDGTTMRNWATVLKVSALIEETSRL